jgi:hypothetical protein
MFSELIGKESMLKILVIGEKDGPRIQPLLKALLNDDRFSLEFWDPVLLKSFNDERLIESGFDVNKSTSYVSRKLALNEIACALAHNRAREYLAVNKFEGVILEDDARIPNVDYFFDSATLFLTSVKVPAVLNFATQRKVEDFENVPLGFPRLQKQICHSPLNVGYVLNKAGAEMLSKTSYRLYMSADWPYSKIDKYVLANAAVAHGDEKNISTIDPENLLTRSAKIWKKSWPNRIRLFSFYWYLRHRKNFVSLTEYIIVMMVPRIFTQLNNLSRRFQ